MSGPTDKDTRRGNEIWINGKLVHSNLPDEPPKAMRERKPPELDPSILAGPKLKIKRAKQHIAELEAALKVFHEGNPYEMFHEQDPKTGENVYRVRVHNPLPCGLPTIIGDVVHNLRSALDHLIGDLVRANKRNVKGGTGFPISGTAKHFEANSIGKIEGVSPKARRLIQRLKPYKGGNTPLWILHELDILDKHNGIIPVAAANVKTSTRWALPMMFTGPDGGLRIGGPGPDGQPMWSGFGTPVGARPVYPLEDNQEIYRSASTGVREEVEAAISVAFGQSQITQGEPVLETLQQLTNFIERTLTIVEKRVI